MTRSSRRRVGPADPEAVREAAALRRGDLLAQERAIKKRPDRWGVSMEQLGLATSKDVVFRRAPGRRTRILNARRSDAFGSLYSARALSEAQYGAAQRYFRDWAISAGVNDNEVESVAVDHGRVPDGRILPMVAARQRVTEAHAGIGGASARLMSGLVKPLVIKGEILPWREVVQAETGETDPKAQCACVRVACENLVEHYHDADRRERVERRLQTAANDNGVQGPRAA